ncbi:5,10-methenyltetrahydrofolate synthetase [Rhodoligotrophos appendicifer]|uniref:5-formyltetrahydrofolate cyclo-ligase n=1 Tax=Rhodoligotrophos appendicifer TaxID=987056 RepID=UPI0011871992|nr:5-formyltetrahydrofolate cyclo-ligase [Rhodoligotrophos appendicifer]
MVIDAGNWDAVRAWRKAERERLVAQRLAILAEDRQALAARIIAGLDRAAEADAGTVVSVYIPFRGEFDLRPWMSSLVDRGVTVALPVVAEKNKPMEFREWTPETKLERGVLGIPIPSGSRLVTPDVTIAPFLAFDREGYRLGYGGGYFDRTLASLKEAPLAIGVGLSSFQIDTIYPQPHDIRMDRIVTEEGLLGIR